MSTEIKDFQKATAERILHIFKDLGRRRVLLADEVGLGKTFVARQVIRMVRDWHLSLPGADSFKVVYICSNAGIADQNISKLGVANRMSISDSRLSMQHLHITLAEKDARRHSSSGHIAESIIPLTPSTSFRMFSSQGTANERALIFCILRHMAPFDQCTDALGDFLSCGVKYWDSLVDTYSRKVRDCGDGYLGEMTRILAQRIPPEAIESIRLSALAGTTGSARAGLINKLRREFAAISIDMLNPDLVIMDEFQRFNSLLSDSGDEQSMLARRFFDDSRGNTLVLLLSATPYKPFSTLEELNADGSDKHYRDFMQLMDFLFVTHDGSDRFRLVWKRYSDSLKSTDVTDLSPLVEAKRDAEDMLYSAMCRTERFNSGIIDVSGVAEVDISQADVLAFAQGQRLIDSLAADTTGMKLRRLPMDYVKSSPYLLSFMDKYELKKGIVRAMQSSRAFSSCRTDLLLLSAKAVNAYRPSAPANARLDLLHDCVFGPRREKRAHLLLWMPPSYPYYQAGGVFEGPEARDFSKIILFSSWEMVPRMVSVMMSYYSELYTLGELKKSAKTGARGKSRDKIRYFSSSSARYGMNRLRKSEGLLEFPCAALASLFSPADFYGMKIAAVRKEVRSAVEALLASNPLTRALPVRRSGNAGNILALMMILDGMPDVDISDLYIPHNAVDVMTDIAIASPAVCAFRISGSADDARRVGKAMVSLFNKPESAAVIDLIYSRRTDDDYYESVLDYCVKGNLQSVFDEYAHMLGKNTLADDIEEALIDTSTLAVDSAESFAGTVPKMMMRCHFAIPFIDKAVTDKAVTRTSNIRKAFNSPFRPFILSTTSIGQEGLDFHWYARKIVHWNLPSNPVDLEQREGRINRFKCLAVRRNVAALFSAGDFLSWSELFSRACAELKASHSDIVPFWCLPVDELSQEQKARLQYIERIVPMYPFSRDRAVYDRLIRVLSLYRMTLGQPRQEELLDLLAGMNLTQHQISDLTINLCPFLKSQCQDNKPLPLPE